MQRQINRGDIFWAAAGREDAKPGLLHPHVIVQADLFNHSRLETVVACALTSNRRRANEPGNFLLEPGEAGLEKLSVVVVSQLCTLQKADLQAYIGSLSESRVQQILAGIRFQQRAFFRNP